MKSFLLLMKVFERLNNLVFSKRHETARKTTKLSKGHSSDLVPINYSNWDRLHKGDKVSKTIVSIAGGL